MKTPLKPTHSFHPSTLRAYDMRGIVGETLSGEDAYYLGKAFAANMGAGKKSVCVGYDGRHSSPELEEQLVAGLQHSGIAVIRVGKGPTPMLYHAVKKFKADGGIMVTGSHNPPTHNGFKMMLASLPLYGDAIQKLGEIAARGEFIENTGEVSTVDVQKAYITHLLSAVAPGGKTLKVAWDAGNGAAGAVMAELAAALPGEHILLNEVIDGSFPSHHPDPSVEANMRQLMDTVLSQNCDLGIAFDGDGDRIGVIDNQGKMLYGDQLMVLLAEDVLREHPGATIIADVKASQVLYDEIARFGGKPIMWKTGHSLIKTKMAEERAVLAGEMSGHIFFADNYGFDDALYAAVKLLNIVAHLSGDLAARVAELPKTCSTPEIRVHVEDTAKFRIVEEIKNEAKAGGANVNDVDGIRALTADGWWLVRASNTEAALVVRCESKTAEGLERLKNVIFGYLRARGVAV